MFRLYKRASGSRAPRALLVWEFGRGRTHIGRLVGVGAHLRAMGFECLVALAETRHDQSFVPLGIRTIQNLIWPLGRFTDVTWTQRPVFGLSDFLANFGVSDPASLAGAIAHYDTLFSLFEPDVVLTESAHGAMLAARGRFPVVAFGTSLFLPPVIEERPLLIHGPQSNPAWPFEQVLAGINEGLLRAGRFPLDNLGQVLDVEAVMPFGPMAFDVYAPWRPTPCLPVFAPAGLARASDEALETFVYLQGRIAETPPIVAGLIGSEGPMRAYIPNLPNHERGLLEARGAIVVDAAVPLPDLLSRSRCVVHHGGPELTSACLAAGVPQVVLAREYDNHVVGGYIRDHRLGLYEGVTVATTAWLIDAISRCRSTEQMAANRDFAAIAQTWFGDDPTLLVARAAAELVPGPRRSG